jgi:hypothetical protein
MKTMSFFFKLLLPLGLLAILFQGCYTQFASLRDDDNSSYEQGRQYSDQTDSTYYDDNDNWQPHQYIGFSYYYPGWRSYWSWDYGCVYPTYWDPWFWGPAFYAGYSYYPHHWGYWNSYPGYGYGYSHYPRSFATRDFGYQRGENNRRNYGAVRSGNAGTGAIYNGQVGASRGNVNLPRTAGGVGSQSGSTITTRTSRSSSRSVSIGRQRGNWYSPSVQQPRHRDQGTATTSRGSRTGSSHGHVYNRSQGTSNGQSRSSGRSSSPSYSPRPSGRTNSAPAPASRNDGGSGGRSSGSGRSH